MSRNKYQPKRRERYKIFHGIAYGEQTNSQSNTFGKVSGGTNFFGDSFNVKGYTKTATLNTRTFKMDNEIFTKLNLGGMALSVINPVLGVLANSANIPIEDEDELTVICDNKKVGGTWYLTAYKNHTKGYFKDNSQKGSNVPKFIFAVIFLILAIFFFIIVTDIENIHCLIIGCVFLGFSIFLRVKKRIIISQLKNLLISTIHKII